MTKPMLDKTTKDAISSNKDLVLDIAKRIYANNSGGINEEMRVNNAVNSIKSAALFVNVWNDVVSEQ